MQYKKTSLITASIVCATSAEYVAGEPWSTLTPSATYKCGMTQVSSSFGIAVQTIASSKLKRDAISQIGDGQIQATITAAAASNDEITTTITKAITTTLRLKGGKIASATTSSTPSPTCAVSGSIEPANQSCKNKGTLQLTLNDGILKDSKNRIGSIVSNRQFQFDGPTPQAGAVLANGWSVTPEGNLALGDQDIFYQCLSGDFYNLYDQSIAEQCSPIHLEVVGLVDC